MRVITASAYKPAYTTFLFGVGNCTAGDSLVHREIITVLFLIIVMFYFTCERVYALNYRR